MSDDLRSDEGGPAPTGIDAMLPYRYAPRPFGGFTVIRKDLLRNLTEATLLKQLSIVRGPAGSGKTTLLAQWRDICREMSRPVAWLTIDQADRDLDRFVAALAEAIERAGSGDIATGFRAMPAMAKTSPIALAQYLASICNGAQQRLAIVLDQFEEACDGPLGQMLNGFLGHSVDTKLVIASRSRLNFPLGNLRARDQIFEIGPSDLNLTPLETHDLFADVPEIYTRRLHYETSGEAVAVGFARRVMESAGRDLIDTGSWQEQLHEYYRSEVLDRLPHEIHEALSRLVVVERFDLSLASALIGRNAADIVERLHHSDGILLRHRGSQEFYFSEMLRRFLETRLGWLTDIEHAALHRRAADWFAARGRYAEALRHAVEAGDRDQARALLDRIGPASVVLQHGVSAAHELFEAVGAAPENTPVDLYLSMAVVHAHEGQLDEAARCLEEVRQAARGDEGIAADIAGQLTLVEAIVAGLRDDTQFAETTPALLHYLESASPEEHGSRALAQVFLSWDRFCRGDIAGALSLVDAAAAEYSETDAVYGSVYMHVHRVLYLLWANEFEDALAEATLAEQVARIFFPHDQRLQAMTAALRAGLLFEVGRPDPLTDMTALAGTVGAVAQWTEIQIWAHVQGAHAAIARGAAHEARGIIAYGLEVAQRLASPRLDWALRLLAVEASLRLGDLGKAAADAATLGLSDPASIDELPDYLTWQERIGATMVMAQLYEARRLSDDSAAMLAHAHNMLSNIDVPRLVVQLNMVEAGRSYRRGDVQSAQLQITAARKISRGGLPVRLFLDGGDGQHTPPASLHSDRTDGTSQSAAAMDMSPAKDDPLTTRERQILLLLGEGYQNKVAAHRLGLSEATVKFHLRNIYRKLHAQNRTQALARYRPFVEIPLG